MIKYMGSKRRIKKHLLPLILKNRKEGQFYIEPFVGGANIFEDVPDPKIGADINLYLISLLTEMANGWIPPQYATEEIYKTVKNNKHLFQEYLVGYYGFQLSYGGKFFGGYRRDKIGKRDYALEAYNNTLKQAEKIKGSTFVHCSYRELKIPANSIVYCDIPYKNTTKYKSSFDHSTFFDWAREQVKSGHKVFVSEYTAPSDFVCIWEKKITSSLTKNTGNKTGVEKLFIHEDQHE